MHAIGSLWQPDSEDNRNVRALLDSTLEVVAARADLCALVAPVAHRRARRLGGLRPLQGAWAVAASRAAAGSIFAGLLEAAYWPR